MERCVLMADREIDRDRTAGRLGSVPEAHITNDATAIAVVAQPSRVGACALYARGETVMQAAVLLQRAGGASVSFDACDYCVRALRRVAAASSGLARFVGGSLATRPRVTGRSGTAGGC